jgi:flagellin-like hook-associated protein FlgL
VGQRNVNLGGLFTTSQEGYRFDYTPSTVNVTPASLTIAAVSAQKVYDGGVGSTATPTASGLKGSDSLTSATQAFTSPQVQGQNGSTLTVSSQSQVGTGLAAFQGSVNTGSAAGAVATLGALQTFQTTLGQASGQNAAETRTLSQQSSQINSTVDAIQIGLGALVDADIGAASAQSAARGVGQQLAFSSLSIANRQPSALLGLVR